MMTTDTQIRTPFRQLMRVGAAAVLALGLAACGGSSSKPDPDPNGGTPPTVESAYDKALKAINMADTPEAVEAELDKAEANILILAPESKKLRQAAEARKTALATMAREKDQKKALMDALAEVDTSDLSDADKIAAAKAAIAALKMALDDADDVSDADKKPYQDRQAAAQTAVNRKEQENALSKASGALRTALAAFSGATATEDQLTAATDALEDLRDALTAAEDLTAAEKAMYQRQADEADEEGGPLKVAEGRLKAHVVQMITDGEIAAAKAAVDMVTDTSPETTVTGAQAKIDAAKKRINEANILDTQKATLRQALAMHEGALGRAKASRNIATRVQGIKDGPIMEAAKKVGLLKRDSSREDWADADAKLAAAETAIDEAEGLSAEKKSELRTELARHRSALDTAIAGRKAFAKEMFYALSGPDVENLGRGLRGSGDEHALNNLGGAPVYANPLKDSAKPSGLKLDPAADGGTLPTDGVNEEPVVFTEVKELRREAAGQLGEWRVTDETEALGENGDAVPAFADRARVYNSRSTLSVSIADYYEKESNRPLNTWELSNKGGDAYDADKRLIPLGTIVDGNIESPKFAAAGNKNWKPDGEGKEITVEGTYQGAPGTYRCTYSSGSDCRVSVFIGGYSMAAGWEFVHKEGAKISIPNYSYLFFGWWVRENSGDGVPRIASAFFNYGGDHITVAGGSINGDATYEGPAAGVYAIHDPLNDKGEAGEFTAKARLEARFGQSNLVPNEGLSGKITDFKLNGGSEDPGWTVMLNHADWAASGDDGVDAGADTAWSIKGIKAPNSGNWVVQMIDTTESDGSVDDGNDEPDAAIGKFYSEHGRTHRVVGAFGARNTTKQYDDDE